MILFIILFINILINLLIKFIYYFIFIKLIFWYNNLYLTIIRNQFFIFYYLKIY